MLTVTCLPVYIPEGVFHRPENHFRWFLLCNPTAKWIGPGLIQRNQSEPETGIFMAKNPQEETQEVLASACEGEEMWWRDAEMLC